MKKTLAINIFIFCFRNFSFYSGFGMKKCLIRDKYPGPATLCRSIALFSLSFLTFFFFFNMFSLIRHSAFGIWICIQTLIGYESGGGIFSLVRVCTLFHEGM
jgi:hypothetical protein